MDTKYKYICLLIFFLTFCPNFLSCTRCTVPVCPGGSQGRWNEGRFVLIICPILGVLFLFVLVGAKGGGMRDFLS